MKGLVYTSMFKGNKDFFGINVSHNHCPRQVVILAGGRGTRLKPITDFLPKAMIQFAGKPFLEYLVDQLRDHGFEKLLLLLGYLPDVIQNYFGDGKSFGIHIEYSISDVENETGRRIRLAAPKLDPCFLLMYCDNYWPLRMTDMWKHFLKAKAMAQVTVYTNQDRYTKNNLLVNKNGLVDVYDKARSLKNLNGVDIGYAIMTKQVVSLIPDANVNFEKSVYPKLVKTHDLSAYITDHRYYSVGDHQRLYLTELFFERRPAIILDRDGVLNNKAPKGMYITKWSDFRWLQGSKKALGLLKSAGYHVIIVTNQAGIARGVMSESDLSDIHARMKSELEENSVALDAIYFCPHGWDDGCECRKPKPGMLFQAQRDFNLDLSRTFFIGDDIRDKQAGDSAGCQTVLISRNMSLLQVVKEKILDD